MLAINGYTVDSELDISAEGGRDAISLNKVNVLLGETIIDTGDGNDTVVITNSQFNSNGIPPSGPPYREHVFGY